MNEEFKNKLLALYFEYDMVTGPYLRKDGRKHLCFNNSKLSKGDLKKKRTVSWPKALVEVRENRRLLNNETVDHNDRDFTNDDLNNLIIRDRIEHSKLDVIRAKPIEIECIWCKIKFILKSPGQRNSNKAGPFCSRKCSGEYGAFKQNGKSEKLDRLKFDKEYFKLNK